MTMKNTLATIVAFLIIFSTLTLTAQADEGMWQPHQLPAMSDELAAKGLEIDAVSISSLTEFPMNAVISLGGCTASFVSSQGLVVTNHHCAYGSILHNSTPEKNLLKDGFLAKSYA
ncbi:MAG: V8-like Glu-specific endopeptidase, partial [Porticoccaceae bacterium]